MPYIQCKDGKTYSRYDQSEYVKKCICEEKIEAQVRFQKCMLDPECKKAYENQEHITQFLLVGVVVLFLIWLRKMFKILGDETIN